MKLLKIILFTLFCSFSTTSMAACANTDFVASKVEKKHKIMLQPYNGLVIASNLVGLSAGLILLNSLEIIGGGVLISVVSILMPILCLLTAFFAFKAIRRYKEDRKKRTLSIILATLSGILGIISLFLLI
jgi:amino acid transporter